MTTAAKTKHLDELHFEHQLWNSEINYFKDELRIYQNRLGEIAIRNAGTDVRAQIEHFQNQFIIQKEQLDILNHEITVHEQWLAGYAKENPIAISQKLFADHKTMHEHMEIFRKLYNELKGEFKSFVVASM